MLTVNPVRSSIAKPDLRQQVDTLVKQEAIHSREHRLYNQRLLQQGFPVEKLRMKTRRDGEKMLAKRKTDSEKILAIAAIEHYTATICHQFLKGRSDILARAYRPLADFWMWHASEEIEHKAVAFDLYVAMNGGFPTRQQRCRALLDAIRLIVSNKMYGTALFLKTDQISLNPSAWYGFSKMMLVDPAFLSGFIHPLLAWLRPGFHPWNFDDSHLYLEWLNHEHEATAPSVASSAT